MNQIRKIVEALTPRQRFVAALTAILVLAGIYGLTRWSRERNFKPLYSNLSSEDAAAVLAKLKETGVEYRFGESSATILVPAERIPELRLQLAAAGIPKSGRIGYELFDKTNLGITDFTEQVNYHRAVEGELERSVMSLSEVEQARVHITFPKDSVFTENREPAKASVMVKVKLAQTLSPQHAQAISQLIASAVEGLTPEAVSVMDMQGNLLARPKKPGDGSEPSEELLSWKKHLEATELAKVNSVLDPLLGSERYRASVDLDCDQTSGEQSEESFDPTRSVITTSQRTEEGSIARDSAGAPGTQSNLPRPVPRASAVIGGGVARRSESMNYETSRMVKKIRLPQGIIRRMSVSVIIDNKLRWEPGKSAGAAPQRILEPPSAAELKIIHDVVAAATGFNAGRGDQLTVESLPFEATLQAQPPEWLMPRSPAPSGSTAKLSARQWLAAGAIVVALLLIGGTIMFIRRRKRKAAVAEAMALEAAPPDQPAQLESAESLAALAEAAAQQDVSQLQPNQREPYKLPPMLTTKTEALTMELIEQARKDPHTLAQVVRSWLSEAK